MDDLISRQKAIEEAHWICVDDEVFDVVQVETLMGLPSVQQWTSCSEWLPIGQEEVIVSCHDDSGDTPFDYTSCGWVTTDGEYWIVDNEINNHVIAWCPLPKPYKGEGHG